MRLCVYDGHKVGLVENDEVVDVSDLVGATADEWPPVAVTRLIRDFDRMRPPLDEALRRPGTALPRVRLAAPLPFPSKVIAAPANYRLHVQEMSRPEMRGVVKQEVHAIDQYGVFLKAPSSIVGPGSTIELPFPDRRTDHEVELGVVIGKTARNVKSADAMSYVFGYTGVLDITVRGGEDRSTRKSFDTFTPVGPFLVTADEVPDPHDLRLRLWVNGELRQDGNTRDMIWNIPRLIEYASHVMTLHPGDLISTGTPDGVGPLEPGDEVAAEVTGIGRMSVTVAARSFQPEWRSGPAPVHQPASRSLGPNSSKP
jgi:2-keto-4-pentenoate hydratase/2-oxohepta-3-ene-1,7-dioic acid hydratase in catechol pathway